MRQKIAVLGAGLVGHAIARDLAGKFTVAAADLDPRRLAGLEDVVASTHVLDLTHPEAVRRAVDQCEVSVVAVPGFLGHKVLRSVIEARCDAVDISFAPEDPLELDALARENHVTAIVDCGVAPGLSNMILGHENAHMAVEHFECLVGGLPKRPRPPWRYKAPFSPLDVIEEYTRPARIVVDGKIEVRAALSDAETVFLPPAGELEAFNTDGLRTLLKTMKIPSMVEKTLRYPGHLAAIRVLAQTGLFESNPVRVNGIEIRPRDLTARLLLPHWQLEENEEEFTLMQIRIRGTRDGATRDVLYTLYDEYDPETGISSMARTTGYTCTAAVRLLAARRFDRKGIIPPEWLGADEAGYHRVLADLAARGVDVQVKESRSP